MDKVYCQGTVLCDSPLIVYSSQFQAKAAAVNVLPRVIGNREAIFLLLTAYTLELRDSIDAAVQFVQGC